MSMRMLVQYSSGRDKLTAVCFRAQTPLANRQWRTFLLISPLVVNSHADHLEAVEYLASFKRPAVVLAGSRMPCAGGRVELDDKRYPICARIHQVGGYSAHAGQSDLLSCVWSIPDAPQEIRLVHGDDDAKAALKSVLENALKATPGSRVVIAE